MPPDYILTTERLGLRNWNDNDQEPFFKITGDPEVMRYFPKPCTREESDTLIDRLGEHIDKHGFGYFAVDHLATNSLVGFIGMMHQDYESPYTPFVDIGWRLSKDYWGKGLATEGAMACMEYGFRELGLKRLFAVTPFGNTPSQKVAMKIGMTKIGEFIHGNIPPDHRLQPMWVFARDNPNL